MQPLSQKFIDLSDELKNGADAAAVLPKMDAVLLEMDSLYDGSENEIRTRVPKQLQKYFEIRIKSEDTRNGIETRIENGKHTGATPLIVAIQNRQPEVVNKLLEQKQGDKVKQVPVDINQVCVIEGKPITALLAAIQAGELAIVKCLLQHRAKIENSDISLAIQMVLPTGQIEILVELLNAPLADGEQENRKILLTNELQATLQKGIFNDHAISLIKILCKAGAKFDAETLHLAVLRGAADLIPHLVAQGADPNVVNHQGQTPLMLALEQDNINLRVLHALLACMPATALNDILKTYGISLLSHCLNKIGHNDFKLAHTFFLEIMSQKKILTENTWLEVLHFYTKYANPDELADVLAHLHDLKILKIFLEEKPNIKPRRNDKIQERIKVLKARDEFEKQRIEFLFSKAAEITTVKVDDEKAVPPTVPAVRGETNPNAGPQLAQVANDLQEILHRKMLTLQQLTRKKLTKPVKLIDTSLTTLTLASASAIRDWKTYVTSIFDFCFEVAEFVNNTLAPDGKAAEFHLVDQQSLTTLFFFMWETVTNPDFQGDAPQDPEGKRANDAMKAVSKFVAYLGDKNNELIKKSPALLPKILLMLVKLEGKLEPEIVYPVWEKIKAMKAWGALLLPYDGQGKPVLFHLARLENLNGRVKEIFEKYLSDLLQQAPCACIDALELDDPGSKIDPSLGLDKLKGRSPTFLDLHFHIQSAEARLQLGKVSSESNSIRQRKIILLKLLTFYLGQNKDEGLRQKAGDAWQVNIANIIAIIIGKNTESKFFEKLKKLVCLDKVTVGLPTAVVAPAETKSTPPPGTAAASEIKDTPPPGTAAALETKATPPPGTTARENLPKQDTARDAVALTPEEQQLLVRVREYFDYLTARGEDQEFFAKLQKIRELEAEFEANPPKPALVNGVLSAATVQAAAGSAAKSGPGGTNPRPAAAAGLSLSGKDAALVARGLVA